MQGGIRNNGKSALTDVPDYGGNVKNRGLTLLNGPENDIVAVTNLMACTIK